MTWLSILEEISCVVNTTLVDCIHVRAAHRGVRKWHTFLAAETCHWATFVRQEMHLEKKDKLIM